MSEDTTTPETPAETPKFSFIRPLQEMPGEVPAAEPAAAVDDNPDVPAEEPLVPDMQIDPEFVKRMMAKAPSDPVVDQVNLTQQDLNSFQLHCSDPETGEPMVLNLPKNFYKVIQALEETVAKYGDKVKDDQMVLRRYTPLMNMAEAPKPGEMPQFEATRLAEGTPQELIAALAAYIMPAAVAHNIIVSTISRVFEQSRIRMLGMVLVDDKAGIGGFVLMNQHLAPSNEQARMFVAATRNMGEEFKVQAEKKGFSFNDIIVPTAGQVSTLGK